MQSYPSPPRPHPQPQYPLPNRPPQPQPQRRKSRWGRRGCGRCLFGCLLMVMVMICLCGGTSLFYVARPPEMMNILVLGVDAREGDSIELARTDSIMIISLDPQRRQVSVMSIPRDVYIDTYDFGFIPINTVTRNAEFTAEGSGVETLIQSIEENLGIEIHRWVRFEFDGFVQVIDAIGGIDVDVPNRIVDYDYPTPDGGVETVIFEEGAQHMDGEIALKYARTRHSDSDYGRTKRQQQVLQAMIEKLVSFKGFYRSPSMTTAILSNSDSNMHVGKFMQYAPSLFLDASNSENINFMALTPDNYLTGDGYGHIIFDVYNSEFQTWLDEHLRPS